MAPLPGFKFQVDVLGVGVRRITTVGVMAVPGQPTIRERCTTMVRFAVAVPAGRAFQRTVIELTLKPSTTVVAVVPPIMVPEAGIVHEKNSPGTAVTEYT